MVFFEDFDEHRNFDYTDVRPGVGLVGGVALSYRLNPMLDINFDALYYYDLTSHHRGYEHLQDYRYLNTLSVTFGISYKFRI